MYAEFVCASVKEEIATISGKIDQLDEKAVCYYSVKGLVDRSNIRLIISTLKILTTF